MPNRLNVEGEDLENVYPGLEFMERVNRGEKPYVGKNVMVIGDGFTAMDCARSALRLGASEVKINIRKTEEYMPIDEQEKHEVKFEKIRFYSLVDTKRIIGENGKVTGIEFLRTKLEYSPHPPYRNAVPMPDSEFILPADSVIVAIGQRPSPGSISGNLKAEGSKIATLGGMFSTEREGLFAAGDCMSGASNVISAIARGRQCALEVDQFLTTRQRKVHVVRLEPVPSTDRERSFDFIERTPMNTLDFEERVKEGSPEVEMGYTEDQAATESKRCYLCSLIYEIDTKKCIYCSACIDVAPRDCIKMVESVPVSEDGSLGNASETRKWNRVAAIAIDNERCIRCGQCYEVCPMNCIHVTKAELIELNIED
jgi:formate dehydrogenase major subunit